MRKKDLVLVPPFQLSGEHVCEYSPLYSDEYAKREESLMGRNLQPPVRGFGFSDRQCQFCVVIYSIGYSDAYM